MADPPTPPHDLVPPDILVAELSVVRSREVLRARQRGLGWGAVAGGGLVVPFAATRIEFLFMPAVVGIVTAAVCAAWAVRGHRRLQRPEPRYRVTVGPTGLEARWIGDRRPVQAPFSEIKQVAPNGDGGLLVTRHMGLPVILPVGLPHLDAIRVRITDGMAHAPPPRTSTSVDWRFEAPAVEPVDRPPWFAGARRIGEGAGWASWAGVATAAIMGWLVGVDGFVTVLGPTLVAAGLHVVLAMALPMWVLRVAESRSLVVMRTVHRGRGARFFGAMHLVIGVCLVLIGALISIASVAVTLEAWRGS